jgi:CheY-like chemotaxis protein
MPDMSGYDVARAARQKPWAKSAYLIALSGWGQATDKERAVAAGFDRHLAKPIDADILTALLDDPRLVGVQCAPSDSILTNAYRC